MRDTVSQERKKKEMLQEGACWVDVRGRKEKAWRKMVE